MPQPASDSNAPRSVGPGPAPAAQVDHEFDLLAFWIEHQKLVIRLLLAAVLGLAIWGALLFKDYRRRTGSENALAKATTAEDCRKVITDWAGTPAAGTAYVRLAEELQKENKPREAAGALREFLERYPQHPLRVPAAHALAAALEIAGELESALAAYQNFATTHSRSAFAPLGVIGQARVLAALGKTDEARQMLEIIEPRFPGNPFNYEARTLLDSIKNPAGTKTGGAPRPTPAPAPAAAPNAGPRVTPDDGVPSATSPPVQVPASPPAKKPKGAGAPPASQAPHPKPSTPASPKK